ncbi:hypothetical protein [Paenibacillus sp. OAS669]|uniref:hypothetical protein n=1 Tax=Paenibacillus sp. OAS669 TaxID=2663821 RepID=UPI00178AE9E4|nr:hypothetical protein [Paenibacillus sp. OAS669]MBE1446624.1 3-dehydroquinate synthase class II [Paenibacillus sp. OAS669]
MKKATKLASAGLLACAVFCSLLPVGTVHAAASVPPAPSLIRVDNRPAGTSDLVTVSGLSPGDVVKVYADGGAASPIGSSTVSSGSSSATVIIDQLGSAGGHIYVTVTQPSYSESRRVVKSFPEEPVSAAPAVTSIRISNRSGGAADQITVRGLHAGDMVKVYKDASKTRLIGSGTVASSTTDGTVISVGQLGPEEGVIYVTVTEPGRRESRVVEKAYDAEPRTGRLQLDQIRVINERGSNDHVIVSQVQPGDIIKLYATLRDSSALAQAVVAAGASTVDIPLALPSTEGGQESIYVTVTTSPLLESERISKRYSPEPVTTALAPGMIVVTNEQEGTDDHIEVFGLAPGDIVKVYPSLVAPHPLAATTVSSNSSLAVIKLGQLGKQAGYIYLTVTSASGRESARTVKSYAAEQASLAPSRSDIQIRNTAGANDTVTVIGLQPGDRVKVYAEEAAAVPIGTAIADATETAVVHTALPETGYGTVYVTVTRSQGEESRRTPKIYAAEPLTLPLSPNHIYVKNVTDPNVDEVTVTHLKPGDTVKLYADAESVQPLLTAWGSQAVSTVPEGGSVVTIPRLQLNSEGGRLFVTVTSPERRESSRVLKAYEAE